MMRQNLIVVGHRDNGELARVLLLDRGEVVYKNSKRYASHSYERDKLELLHERPCLKKNAHDNASLLRSATASHPPVNRTVRTLGAGENGERRGREVGAGGGRVGVKDAFPLGAARALGSAGSLDALVALGAAGSLGALLARGALGPGLALIALGAARAHDTGGSTRALGALRALLAVVRRVAAILAVLAVGAGQAVDSVAAVLARGALGALDRVLVDADWRRGRALRTHGSGRADASGLAAGSLVALVTLGSGGSARALGALGALGALVTLLALGARQALVALVAARADGALSSGVAALAHGTALALVALGTHRTGLAGGALHAGGALDRSARVAAGALRCSAWCVDECGGLRVE